MLSTLRIPIVQQCNDNQELFVEIKDSNIIETACSLFQNDEYPEEYRTITIQFIEGCCINNCLREFTLKTIGTFDYAEFTCIDENYPAEIKKSLFVIISYYLDYYGFHAAELTFDCYILHFIVDIIEANSEIALDVLEKIMHYYDEKGRLKEILFNDDFPAILDSLEKVYETSTDIEENRIDHFLEYYKQVSTSDKQSGLSSASILNL